MSNEAVEKLAEAEIPAEELNVEGIEAPGGDEVPEGNPPSPDIDMTTVEIEGLTGTQPDGEEKKRNQAFARQRVREKELQDQLDTLKAKPLASDTDNPKPKRVDFINDETIYDKYSGNADFARAAYEDAVEDWEAGQRGRHNESIDNTQGQLQESQRLAVVHENFESNVAKYQGRVKDLDAHLMMGERNMTFVDNQGVTQDGSIVIKERFGEDAPLMLAAIGANRELADFILGSPDTFVLSQRMTNLQTQVKQNVSSNALSQAPEEVAVKGDAAATLTPVEKAMAEAAKKGDIKEYQRLKGRQANGRTLQK